MGGDVVAGEGGKLDVRILGGILPDGAFEVVGVGLAFACAYLIYDAVGVGLSGIPAFDAEWDGEAVFLKCAGRHLVPACALACAYVEFGRLGVLLT